MSLKESIAVYPNCNVFVISPHTNGVGTLQLGLLHLFQFPMEANSNSIFLLSNKMIEWLSLE